MNALAIKVITLALRVCLALFCRSVDTNRICKYDACIEELFYPMKNVYSASVIDFSLVLTQNATAMAMTLIFIAFGALFVSRPWSF